MAERKQRLNLFVNKYKFFIVPQDANDLFTEVYANLPSMKLKEGC